MGTKEIAEALLGAGFKVTEDSFKIEEPVKKLGEHKVHEPCHAHDEKVKA